MMKKQRALIENGHRILYGDYIMGSAKVLMQDPCAFGFPELDRSSHPRPSKVAAQPSMGPALREPVLDEQWSKLFEGG